MTPSLRPQERRRLTRFDMTTRDCRLTLLPANVGRHEPENCILCILIDLSYSGLRFRSPRLIHKDELLEFLVTIASPLDRSGFLRGHVCWVGSVDSQWYDCGVELLPESKGLLGPDEEWPSATEGNGRSATTV